MKIFKINIILATYVMLLIIPKIVYCSQNNITNQKYIETTGDNSIEYNYSITGHSSGYIIELSSSIKREKCITDSAYHCQSWEVQWPGENTKFVAKREKNTIIIKGVTKGKKINKTINISNLPWLQFWEYGIQHVLKLNTNTMEFISIDSNKPTKPATFRVKCKGEDNIKIDTKIEPATVCTVNIKGLSPIIFHADFWFRKNDLKFLRSDMPQGPFMPMSIFQIKY